MTDETDKSKNPVPRLGTLRTASDIRRAFVRLGNAVLEGTISPKVANSAAYCVAGAGRARELELAEQLSRQLAAHEARPDLPAPAAQAMLEHMPSVGPRVIEGETEVAAREDRAA